ncbi:threonine-rich protein-like [Anneissia japonica]|uniref:threonine-rich protein-like n=1 Tax=Anneissia japonica TaxID=1529436 RepID=UPI0014257027|nr:threonine-rich protein-like [Anneissia japonica]
MSDSLSENIWRHRCCPQTHIKPQNLQHIEGDSIQEEGLRSPNPCNYSSACRNGWSCNNNSNNISTSSYTCQCGESGCEIYLGEECNGINYRTTFVCGRPCSYNHLGIQCNPSNSFNIDSSDYCCFLSITKNEECNPTLPTLQHTYSPGDTYEVSKTTRDTYTEAEKTTKVLPSSGGETVNEPKPTTATKVPPNSGRTERVTTAESKTTTAMTQPPTATTAESKTTTATTQPPTTTTAESKTTTATTQPPTATTAESKITTATTQPPTTTTAESKATTATTGPPTTTTGFTVFTSNLILLMVFTGTAVVVLVTGCVCVMMAFVTKQSNRIQPTGG